MGFMLIDVPPGDHMIQMRFETPMENRIGQWLSHDASDAGAAVLSKNRLIYFKRDSFTSSASASD